MAVANAFIKKAKKGKLKALTPMKLQKLLFFAQSWYLARKGKPLLDDSFSRWPYGPVIPSLYHEFKEYGASAITGYGGHVIEREGEYVRVQPIVSDASTETWAFIDEIIDVYGAYSGSQLSAITHESGTAWKETGEPNGEPMTNEQLAEFIVGDRHYQAQLN